ncbi:GtrA family protein [Marinicella sp. S1101]|uniref:GtrA family protein n=1 Tax=Marinicella marina TaxID=2996016 RepID=UPI002260FEA2|nr:GtrA family protein [Marinicella marina]MCX7553155.1 GtrA family protein [Marinicella marina]MDJ1138887.1 GtrA family protein [Marinicella marina]
MGQVMRYGMVGVVAALVHIIVALIMHKLLLLSPFWSNAVGVFAGFVTAYLGHYHYSFKDPSNHSSSLPRFAATSVVGLLLQQLGVLKLVNQYQFDYATQALPVLMVVVPAVTFLLSKFWAFR